VIEMAASAPQQWISIVAGVGIVLAVSEELVIRPIYADDGLLSWQVLQVGRPRALVPQCRVWLNGCSGRGRTWSFSS
jgi:hypothetical protein